MSSASIPLYSIQSLTAARQATAAVITLEDLATRPAHEGPRRYACYCFLWVTKGRGRHAIDLHEYDMNPGTLFFIAPGQIHRLISSQSLEGQVLLFNDTVLAEWKGQSKAWQVVRGQARTPVSTPTDDVGRWVERFRAVASALTTHDEFTLEAASHAIGLFLIQVARLSKEKATRKVRVPHDYLYDFQQLIEKHFRTMKTPREYAEKLHITANYLNALCVKRAGKSAGELIRQRVLLEAKRLLAHTNLSITEIAFQLSFEDNSYFGRFFKKYSGMSPGEFRKSQR